VFAQRTEDADSRFNRGDEYLQLNNYKEAIREFEKAISLKPDWAEAYFQLGIAHSKIPVTDKDRSAHNKAALKAFKKVIQLKPTWAEAYNELGRRYSESGESAEAVKSFKEAIRLKPDLADAHLNLAIAYLYKAGYTEGIESLKETLRIEPNLALAHKLLGLTYLAMENREKAFEEYNILKSLDLEMANFLHNAIQRPEKFTFGVTSGTPIYIPKPEYPLAAQRNGLTGRIVVEVLIDEGGKVTSAHALNGPPELQRAAEAAALKARFKPTKLSGTPVAVKGVISFDFSRQ